MDAETLNVIAELKKSFDQRISMLAEDNRRLRADLNLTHAAAVHALEVAKLALEDLDTPEVKQALAEVLRAKEVADNAARAGVLLEKVQARKAGVACA